MGSSFSDNLTLLRRERGLSQKTASVSLNISQAVLSHYENGIRECGLDFVIRAADFYGVSCDFLLGRTVQRTNIKAEKTPPGKTANEKTINSSVSVIFSLLKKIDSKELTSEVTNYFCSSAYTMLRLVTNQKNDNTLFKLNKSMFSAVACAEMTILKARIRETIKNESLEKKLPLISNEIIEGDYPASAQLVQKMVHTAENTSDTE